MEAWGTAGGCHHSSQELSFEKSSTPEALGKVQEVSSSVISYGRGRAAIILRRSSTSEASHGGGQAAAGQDNQCEGPGA